METKTKAVINWHYRLRQLCEGAIMIAVAEILSFLPLYKLPWGGSIDFAMLPIILFCVRWGFAPGMLVSIAHGFLQMLFEGGVAIGWQSIVGDFLIAYGIMGLAGLWKGKFIPATALACIARFAVHYVVGATIWAEYMPESFFGMTMTTPWFYSLLYNASYMLPNMLLPLLAAALLFAPLKKYILGQDLQ